MNENSTFVIRKTMNATDLITDELPPLKFSDTGIKATDWMEDFKVSHLPVLDKGTYLGLIAESELLDLENPEEAIMISNPQLIKVHVLENQHIFEVIRILSAANLSVIAVVDAEMNYMGAITIHHLIAKLSEMPVIRDQGGIIILEVNLNDYALSEISRIVEGEDAKIIGNFITGSPDSTKLEVTIKLNTNNIGAVISSLERHQYIIVESYDFGDSQEYLKDRFDNFMNYLNL